MSEARAAHWGSVDRDPASKRGALQVLDVGLCCGLAEMRVHGGPPTVEFCY
jgi:hypothetical protein